MLSVTIADAELVITNLYGGQDYSAIKSAVIPTQMTNTQQEVRSYYLDLQTTFNQLFDKTKTELDLFVFDMLTAGGEVNQKTQWLIGYSNDLFTFKSQLADLLTNEGTEAEINAKEQEIEDIKEEMLTRAADLKMIEISIGNRMSSAKMEKLRRYATDLNTLTEELNNYRQENNEFLRHEFVGEEGDIQYKSFELYSGIFEFLDSNQWLNTSRGFNNGQWTEFKLVKEQITEAKYRYRGDIKYRNNANSDIQILFQPSRIFDCDQSNNNNGTLYYNIKDFLPGVSEDAKEFYVNYSRQLHVATNDYVCEKSVYKSSKNAIQWRISDFEEILDKQSRNIAALRSTKMELSWMERETQEKSNGHYEGTPEQQYALDTTRGAWFEAEAEYLRQFYTNRSKVKTFELYNSIFPEFYSGLSTLASNTDNLNNNVSSLYATYTDLQTSRDTAYDLLQSLTDEEADYVAALADYEAKLTNFNDAVTTLGTYSSIKDDAYNFLQTTLAGEAEYQATYPFGSYGSSGAVDPSFAYGSGFDSDVYSTAIQSDGKILVGGGFLSYNGTSVNRIIRLNADGSIDTSFVTGSGFDGNVYSTNIQSDGKILVGGSFTAYYGTPAYGIIRLNTDGSIDTSFVYDAGFNGAGFNGVGYSTNIQSDGKILVGGSFIAYYGTPASRIIRLNSDGSIDTSFVSGTGFNSTVNSITIQSDGKIVVAGDFTNYNETSANRIIRLNADGSIDTSFVYGTGFDSTVRSITTQSDGKILVGGDFASYQGTPASRIIRLNSDGSRDTSFVSGTGFNNSIHSTAIQSDGKIVVGGEFGDYNGTGADRIIRLNSNGSVDTSFVYGTGFSAPVRSIAIKSNGAILVGGDFSTFVMFSEGGSYTQTEIDRITALHYVYLGAQSDYDTKLAAKDAYYSDVVAPAEVLKNDAYTFLQDLTDEDADYQAGLIDWNSKSAATDLFYNETFVPAWTAYQSTVDELIQYLSTTWGSELNLSYTGTALKGFKDDRDSSNTLLEQALAAKPTTEAAFMEARNSMTLVQSTPLEKRQGIWKFKEMREKHEQVERLESLATRYSEIFPRMILEVSQYANEVRYRDEAYFASRFQDVKDFLDGEHINNLGRNLYFDKLNEQKVGEIQSQKNRTILESIFIPLLQDWNMRFGSDNNTNENIANVSDNAINRLQIYGSGIGTLQQKISHINNELFRQFDGFSFADRIINEVNNNGTPLI